MRKNIIYLLIVSVLAFATYWFVFREDGQSFSQSEANFTVSDTSKISKIFMTDIQGNTVTLSRKDKEWLLDNKYIANWDMVNLLLTALKNQKPEQPVPANYHDKVVKDLATSHVKVEVYEADELTHKFYVGKDPAPNNLTYMLTQDAKRPFIVRFPFENAFLGIRYNTNSETWRSKQIFYRNAPIEYVDVKYKDSVQYSFKVVQQGDKLAVSGNRTFTEPMNEKRVKSFLGFMDKLFCVAYENKNTEKEKILSKGREMGTFHIKRKNHDEEKAVIYFRPADKGTRAPIVLNGVEYDNEYFYGYINDTDFINVSSVVIQKMFRTLPEFFEADAVQN